MRVGDGGHNAEFQGTAHPVSKRPIPLSITHKVSTDGGPQFDISETGQASPHD